MMRKSSRQFLKSRRFKNLGTKILNQGDLDRAVLTDRQGRHLPRDYRFLGNPKFLNLSENGILIRRVPK